MNHRIALLAVLLGVTTISLVSAPLDGSLISSLQTALAGETVTFAASLLNDSPNTEFLNGLSLTLSAPLTFDTTPFFLFTPPLLAPGHSYVGPIFDVIVPPGTPVGVYLGTADILGGETANSQDLLARLEFGVQMVPEPRTILLIAPALAMFALMRRSVQLPR